MGRSKHKPTKPLPTAPTHTHARAAQTHKHRQELGLARIVYCRKNLLPSPWSVGRSFFQASQTVACWRRAELRRIVRLSARHTAQQTLWTQFFPRFSVSTLDRIFFTVSEGRGNRFSGRASHTARVITSGVTIVCVWPTNAKSSFSFHRHSTPRGPQGPGDSPSPLRCRSLLCECASPPTTNYDTRHMSRTATERTPRHPLNTSRPLQFTPSPPSAARALQGQPTRPIPSPNPPPSPSCRVRRIAPRHITAQPTNTHSAPTAAALLPARVAGPLASAHTMWR